MNCCDYQCDQGRNCPARVAKVGQRYLGPDPIPASRGYLKDLARAMLLVFLAMLLGSLIVPFLR